MVSLVRRRGITDERVLEAMGRVPRELFVPRELERRAYDDSALPIGLGRTISQPAIVAHMCALLAVGPGSRVLDVGVGSGYAAAVLATMGCDVVGIELLPELAVRAEAALANAGISLEVRVGDGRGGAPDRAPFDAISVAAAAARAPEALVAQLVEGGRLVLPVGTAAGQRLIRLTRTADTTREERFEPCLFVPLVAPADGTLGR